MTQPLYGIKAEFFKTLGHPARIRALELLSGGEQSVTELQHVLKLESSHLSQQLAVLRKAGLVQTRKQGTTVYYSLVAPEIAQLLALARHILSGVMSGQIAILADLTEASGTAANAPIASVAPALPLAAKSSRSRRRRGTAPGSTSV